MRHNHSHEYLILECFHGNDSHGNPDTSDESIHSDGFQVFENIFMCITTALIFLTNALLILTFVASPNIRYVKCFPYYQYSNGVENIEYFKMFKYDRVSYSRNSFYRTLSTQNRYKTVGILRCSNE